MKAIHGGKAKNDRIDAGKIARLLRGGTFPLAYAYPKGMRETRDLLRRRTYLVRKRAELMTHLQILNSQYNLGPFTKKLSFAANRAELDIAQRFADPSVQHSAAADLAVIDALEAQIATLELYLTRTAKVDDVQTYHRLQTIPGVGKVLALILLYEMHDVQRFDLDSGCRVAVAPSLDLLALDEAWSRLAKAEPAKAELVKLRFFAGLTMPEAAAALNISLATAERYWTFAKSWLYAELVDDARRFG